MRTAQAQGQMNKETAVAQANLNRIDQYTPQGSITYQQTGTNADGTPKYQQTQQFSPEQQALYNQQNQVGQELGNLAVNNIGRVQSTQSKDFNFDGMTPLQTGVQGGNIQSLPFGVGGDIQKGLNYGGLTKLPGTDDFSADANRVADSVYGQYTSRLDPQFQQRENDMRARLAAQGISDNSDAFRREEGNFDRSRTDAYGQANFQAQQAGAAEQSRLFGLSLAARQQGQGEVNDQGQFANSAQAQQYAQDVGAAGFNNQAQNQGFNQNAANAQLNNQGRQQQITEASYLRNLPLNEIASLLGAGGGVQNPQFQNVAQVGVASPDYMGAAYNSFNAQQSNYNTQMANRSAGLGSLFGLAGTAASLISDMRFKANIKRVGKLANGIMTYTYNYIGDRTMQFGVMAQQVLRVKPQAVGVLPNGVMYVNYAKVYG
jgi:hypothetical protein